MLRCEECDALCEYAAGWIAYRVDDEEAPKAHVTAYCPTCAEREFDLVSQRRPDDELD
jgi:Zn finger protein HypA/HybF involved in hydrogenase expression